MRFFDHLSALLLLTLSAVALSVPAVPPHPDTGGWCYTHPRECKGPPCIVGNNCTGKANIHWKSDFILTVTISARLVATVFRTISISDLIKQKSAIQDWEVRVSVNLRRLSLCGSCGDGRYCYGKLHQDKWQCMLGVCWDTNFDPIMFVVAGSRILVSLGVWEVLLGICLHRVYVLWLYS